MRNKYCTNINKKWFLAEFKSLRREVVVGAEVVVGVLVVLLGVLVVVVWTTGSMQIKPHPLEH